MKISLLIIFIISVYEFIRFISILFNEHREFTGAGHKYLAISFVVGLLSGVQLFGIYDFISLVK